MHIDARVRNTHASEHFQQKIVASKCTCKEHKYIVIVAEQPHSGDIIYQYSRAFAAISARGVIELAALLTTVLTQEALLAVTRVAISVDAVLAPAVLATVLVEAVVD